MRTNCGYATHGSFSVLSITEVELLFVRMSAVADCDFGSEDSFNDYSILFVILYLCRGNTDGNGSVIDEDITEETLVNGMEVNGERISPVLMMGSTTRNGKPIGKGFNIEYAYDYKTAVDKLLSGKIRSMIITCSPGDGKFPKGGDKEKEYCDAFLDSVHSFYHNGGGVFWFLESYPFTYEADLYFKRYFGFEAVKDRNTLIAGGMLMKRMEGSTPSPGHYVACDNLLGSDIGLLYEGETLCELNEQSFEQSGFRVLARESTGYAAIIVKPNDDESEGRMVIDTASTKLFTEFSCKGVASYFSNAVVWLCNTKRCNADSSNSSSKTGIEMSGMNHEMLEPKPFVPRSVV